MNTNTFQTLSEAYRQALIDVTENPQYICSPRGQKIYEITDYQFKVTNPTSGPIVTMDLDRNLVIRDYTEKEKELYDSKTNSAAAFAKASRFWTKIANPDGTVNSAYGKLIWEDKSLGNPQYESQYKPVLYGDGSVKELVEVRGSVYRTPWEWCVSALKSDKDTRQAILKFSRPDHHWNGNKDFVCTISGNFLIREDKLNLTIVMRSNDLVKGMVYDCPWFVSLIDKMLTELKDTYPNLKMGTYTHFTHSAHVYFSDLEKVKKMLGK